MSPHLRRRLHRAGSIRLLRARGLGKAIVLLVVVVCGCGSQALAQEKYILSGEDTWKPQNTADPASPEGQLAEAKRALAAGDVERAETLTTNWIKQHERHPLLAEAYLIRGDAKVADGDEYNALFDYEYIARMFPGSETFVSALQRELTIATQYAEGRKRKQWGLRIVHAYDEAEELLIRVQERLPGSRLAEQAGMTLADYYFNRRQMSLATDAYDLFIQNYPRSPMIDKARRRLIYSYLATFKGPEFGATGLYEARDRLKQLKVQQPAEAQRMGADALLTRIDESDAQKMLSVAKFYYNTGEPISSELTIRRLVARYPHTSATAEALRFVPQVLAKLPERMRMAAPDYRTIAAGLIDQPAPVKATPTTAPIAAPSTTTAPAPETAPTKEGS